MSERSPSRAEAGQVTRARECSQEAFIASKRRSPNVTHQLSPLHNHLRKIAQATARAALDHSPCSFTAKPPRPRPLCSHDQSFFLRFCLNTRSPLTHRLVSAPCSVPPLLRLVYYILFSPDHQRMGPYTFSFSIHLNR